MNILQILLLGITLGIGSYFYQKPQRGGIFGAVTIGTLGALSVGYPLTNFSDSFNPTFLMISILGTICLLAVSKHIMSIST